MSGGLDADWVLVGAYGLAALACMYTRHRERASLGADDFSYLWPAFWSWTAALLAFLAIGHALDLGGALADAGRDQARSQGWYDTRRAVQAVAVGIIAIAWAVAVIVAIWRIPPRRRRYLPVAVAVATLVCFVAVHNISLHQLDAVLDRRVAGMRVASAVEFVLVGLVTLGALWRSGRLAPPAARHVVEPVRR